MSSIVVLTRMSGSDVPVIEQFRRLLELPDL